MKSNGNIGQKKVTQETFHSLLHSQLSFMVGLKMYSEQKVFHRDLFLQRKLHHVFLEFYMASNGNIKGISDLTQIMKNFFFYILYFLNKHTTFHYNKLKLQQNDTNIKHYTRLKF